MAETSYELRFDNDNKNIGGGGAKCLPVDAEHCAGCTACMAICPKNAISMSEDIEGFQSPVLDENLCINCGLCKKVCPIINQNKNPRSPLTFAAWIKDFQRRLRSSSGGIAYAIAKKFILDGGIVCGAATEGFEVKHILIDNVDDLHKTQGSKYVQSYLGNCFREIKKLIAEGKKVLFTGTPCQVSGIRNYLNNDQNLFTFDIVCHGVPSPKVLRKYVDELKKEYYTATTLTFRDKVDGWSPVHNFSLYDESGQTVFRESGFSNVYLTGFLGEITDRNSCGKCPFTSAERVGDLTLADFWGIENINPALNDRFGTSLIIPNNPKGEMLALSIKDEFAMLQPVPIEAAINFQSRLREPLKPSPLRKDFFDHMNSGGSVINFIESKAFNVGVLNFHFSPNYGARLVTYSLCEAIKRLGYNPEVINLIDINIPKEDPIHEEFRKKYFNRSPQLIVREQLRMFSHRWKKIVVGSDQVWHLHDTGIYMLDWAGGKKTFIAYAASFGHDFYNGRVPRASAEVLLKRFDYISVREKSGVDICRRDFHVPALHVIDPTMLLKAEDYEKIINADENVFTTDEPYIFSSFIDLNVLKSNLNESLKTFKVYDGETNEDGKEHKMEDWLSLIRNAKYIITSSFHACVFSIIFHKQFIMVGLGSGNGRVPSLLQQLKIPLTRIVPSVQDVTVEKLEEKIYYDEVEKQLAIERKKGIDFLKMALEKPTTQKGEIFVVK
ncbi:MAG: polysaccharide pyruvyl transferase family protein [Selenomonadaceae bacterium]|nr:polysaccharide pyruvyl transferase family protein [Selenomonadaceae bacterium]